MQDDLKQTEDSVVISETKVIFEETPFLKTFVRDSILAGYEIKYNQREKGFMSKNKIIFNGVSYKVVLEYHPRFLLKTKGLVETICVKINNSVIEFVAADEFAVSDIHKYLSKV